MTYEISDGLSIQYAYGYADAADLDVRYAYSETILETSDLGVVYQYDMDVDRWDPQRGFWATSTQEIGNSWPNWADARINTRGTTQQLINAWGMNYDKAKEEYAKYRRNLFLDTAELSIPSVFSYGEVAEFDEIEKPRRKNLLFNTDFSLRGLARRNLPVWWSTEKASTGEVGLARTPVLAGTYSFSMKTDPGEEAFLRQWIQAPVEKGNYLTASIWHMSPIPLDMLELDETQLSLAIYVIYMDGTPDVQRVALKRGTNGFWIRSSVSMLLEKSAWLITFRVEMKNTGTETMKSYLDCVQLEVGASVTMWRREHLLPIPMFNERLNVGAPVDVYVDEGPVLSSEEIISGYPVSYSSRVERALHWAYSYDRLWHRSTPSHATTAATSNPPTAESIVRWGSISNAERERFATAWRITDNKIEQYNYEIPKETVSFWGIGEMHLDEDQSFRIGIDTGVTRTLEAVMVFGDFLAVLCLETEGGVTRRVIKFLNPRTRWPVPRAHYDGLPDLHLECAGDVDIGFATGTADYMGVSDENPEQLLIRVDGSYYLVSLEYDYFYMDQDTRRVIMRTQFDGTLVTV